jgi:replicative DNA helicase
MPKRLLRSVIEFDTELSPAHLVGNFEKLRKAVDAGTIVWGREDDEGIYRYVDTFYLQTFELPSMDTVRDYFKSFNRTDIVERVDDIGIERPYARGNYANLLRSVQEEQQKVKVFAVLKKTSDILIKGVTDEQTGETRRGFDAALEEVRSLEELRIDERIDLLNIDARSQRAIDQLWDAYGQAKLNPGGALGSICGISEIDDVCRGAKPGELYVHGAYPGELKSTFALNWAYNCVTRFKKNVVYFTFEMPIAQVNQQLACMHSASFRFGQDKQRRPLDYRAIRDGSLTEAEEQRYRQVLDDWSTNPTYTCLEVVSPTEPWSMDRIDAKLRELQRGFDVGLVVLDHGQLIAPRRSRRRQDYVIELNSIVDDAKRLALNFQRDAGRGVPVLLLWQINREGKAEADKSDGLYRAKAFTYANNVEKAADVITTSYLNDELRSRNSVKFTNIKNRDNPLFAPFEATTNLSCRRIWSRRVEEARGIALEDV